MSVIFKTLQKLRHTGQEGRVTYEEPKRRRRGFSSGRVFLPIGLFAALALLVLSVTWWDSRAGVHRTEGGEGPEGGLTKKAFLRAKEVHPSERDTKMGEAFEKGGPNSEKAVQDLAASPKSDVETGAYFLPAAIRNKPRVDPFAYLPPSAIGPTEKKTFPPAKSVRFSPQAKKTGGKKKLQKTVHRQPQMERNKETLISKASSFSLPVERSSKLFPDPAPGASQLQRKGLKDDELMIAAFQSNSEKEKKGGMGKAPRSPGADEGDLQTSDQEKSARVSRLIADIQEEMRREDVGKVAGLLKELEAVKGVGNDYVMRLRAFWFLKQGKYDAARSQLEALLARNEEDIEAGLNMAILEMQTNRVKLARKRLMKMRRNHKDNRMISAVMHKIFN